MLVEEVRMREVWCVAQEVVCQELASAEASQSLLRLAHLLAPSGSPPPASTAPHHPKAGPERWQAGAEESLRQEMEEAVLSLSTHYETVLARHRAGDTTAINSVSASMETLLAELAAIMAQKALIDGQLAAVQSETEEGDTLQETLTIVEEVRDPVGAAGDVAASEAHLLMFLGGCDSSLENLVQPALDQAEFTFLYQQAATKANGDIANLLPVSSMSNLTTSVETEASLGPTSLTSTPPASLPSTPASLTATPTAKLPGSPKVRRHGGDRHRIRRASDITGMRDSCRTCDELRTEVTRLKRMAEAKRVRDKQTECQQCQQYLENMKVQ